MRLLIVSHTPHYKTDAGLAGWGPTVRELDHLASLFTQVVHLAPVHDEQAPPSSRVYRAANLEMRTLRPAGGPRVRDKLGILAGAPAFMAIFLELAKQADAVHIRSPANVALLALLAKGLAPKRPWWVKYAGNWRPEGETAQREARSYRLQRRLLRRDRGWAVTVNGRFDGDPAHIRPFLNPSLDRRDLEQAQDAAAVKSRANSLGPCAKIIFVGRLDEAKGAARAIEAVAGLEGAEIDVAGDGPLRAELEKLARHLGVTARFHGWLPRPELDRLYAEAHIILLPSLASEGWPKVLSEAMAWGVVPVASEISAIPGILAELGVGQAVPPRDLEAQRGAMKKILAGFGAESRRATAAAELFSYKHYLDSVRSLFADRFGLVLPP